MYVCCAKLKIFLDIRKRSPRLLHPCGGWKGRRSLPEGQLAAEAGGASLPGDHRAMVGLSWKPNLEEKNRTDHRMDNSNVFHLIS